MFVSTLNFKVKKKGGGGPADSFHWQMQNIWQIYWYAKTDFQYVYKLPKVLNNKPGNGGGVGGDNKLQFFSDIFTRPVVLHAPSDIHLSRSTSTMSYTSVFFRQSVWTLISYKLQISG